MNFLIDTDVCSAFLRGEPHVSARFLQYGGGLAVSAVVVGELWVAVWRFGAQSRFAQGLRDLLQEVAVLAYDLNCAERFGQLRAELLARGFPAAPADVMIAATALTHDLTLVTHNQAHFVNVPDLRLADWLLAKD